MGNYSSKLFNTNVHNDIKVKEHTHIPQEPHATSEQVPQSDEKSGNLASGNDEIVQTPTKKIGTLQSRKRINAIPEYLKTRKPYLETDLDHVSTTENLCLDPRSPNVAYPRTPILLQSNSSISTKNVGGENLSKFNSAEIQTNVISAEIQTNVISAEIQTNVIELDPRSPASDFDRTPISAIKVSKQFNAQCQDNVNGLRKSNSSLDICIKLSYCETTSLFNIPEIQALPDIVVSLRRSCSLKDNLNEKSSSLTTGDVNTNSELVSDNVQTVKLHVNNEIPSIPDDVAPVKHADTENDVTDIDEKDVKVASTCEVSATNTELPKNIDNARKATDPEEKFKVWRDSFSKLPEYSCTGNANNSQKNSSLPDKEEILIEFDDCSVMNSMRSNQTKKIEKTEGFIKEKKSKSVDKKNMKIKKENKLVDEKKLFSPEFKTVAELAKNRTPFSNRSNNNRPIQVLSSKSPQQFLGHRKLFVSENKNLQENTPLAHKKRVKNVPSKLNGTQWDSDSTIII